ncbi:MAG: nucleoside monophosphate kinase, partial [Anaerotignum sp.]|nr:nucleoside monophosphate kinase [Anaerotignum sp.]
MALFVSFLKQRFLKETRNEMIPVEKNKIYEMNIDALGSNGEGIGRIDGYTVFVEGALPGEKISVLIVKVKKNYGYGKLMEILEVSPERREPMCPVAKQCGGCQLQHLSYEAELAYKTREVKDVMERIGGIKDVEVKPALGMEDPWRYRNKAQFPVGRGKDGCAIGFYAKRSHRIVDTDKCFLQNECNDVIVGIVRERLSKDDCKDGYILDGFPRTIAQAEALAEQGIEIDRVLSIELDDEKIVERLVG